MSCIGIQKIPKPNLKRWHTNLFAALHPVEPIVINCRGEGDHFFGSGDYVSAACKAARIIRIQWQDGYIVNALIKDVVENYIGGMNV